MSTTAPQSFLFRVSSALATGLGTGLSPWMPGTCGSVLGLVLVYFCPIDIWVLGFICALAWLVIYHYEKVSGSHDSSAVVIDEIAGIFCSFYALNINLPILLAGFVLFRFFDILKPFPIGWVDRNIPGALGTLLDDLIAGFLTCIFLHLAVNWAWL